MIEKTGVFSVVGRPNVGKSTLFKPGVWVGFAPNWWLKRRARAPPPQ